MIGSGAFPPLRTLGDQALWFRCFFLRQQTLVRLPFYRHYGMAHCTLIEGIPPIMAWEVDLIPCGQAHRRSTPTCSPLMFMDQY
jgi:hypothetical protein